MERLARASSWYPWRSKEDRWSISLLYSAVLIQIAYWLQGETEALYANIDQAYKEGDKEIKRLKKPFRLEMQKSQVLSSYRTYYIGVSDNEQMGWRSASNWASTPLTLIYISPHSCITNFYTSATLRYTYILDRIGVHTRGIPLYILIIEDFNMEFHCYA